jgi:hypothetical protein
MEQVSVLAYQGLEGNSPTLVKIAKLMSELSASAYHSAAEVPDLGNYTIGKKLALAYRHDAAKITLARNHARCGPQIVPPRK